MNICFAHSLSCKLFPISPRHFCKRRVLCLSFQLSLLGLSVQRLRWWWAQVDSNHRPRAYQARALTTWAMSPFSSLSVHSSLVPEVSLFGGDDGIRTHDPLLAGQVLSQLSYTPILSYGSYFSILFCLFSKTATVSENRTTIDVSCCFRFSSDNTSRRLFSFSFDFCPAVYFSQVTFSIERRWSSRTFRYGYLVTT